jgi:hypothetical protein
MYNKIVLSVFFGILHAICFHYLQRNAKRLADNENHGQGA